MVHNLTSFWQLEANCQTVLPDRSLINRTKLVENAKIEKFKCDILSNFQTLCMLSFCNITNQNSKCDILCNFPTLYICSTVFNGSLGGNSFRCISRDKLWAEAGSGALKLSWEMAIIMVLSGLAFFLVTLAIVMAKKLSVLTKAGLHLPHRNSNASTAGSLSYTR